MRLEECLDRGLIKKDPLASERVESSLMIAERFLRSSNRNLEIDFIARRSKKSCFYMSCIFGCFLEGRINQYPYAFPVISSISTLMTAVRLRVACG